jgi:ADP-heptose:LPS heptosyltransferase
MVAGYGVGLVGGPAEPDLAGSIVAQAHGAVDLTATNLFDIAGLAAKAALCVGNDTGPTHLIAAVGAPTLTLFSDASDPVLAAPRGARAAYIHLPKLDDLRVERVLDAAAALPFVGKFG